jgi:hypothetical protein
MGQHFHSIETSKSAPRFAILVGERLGFRVSRNNQDPHAAYARATIVAQRLTGRVAGGRASSSWAMAGPLDLRYRGPCRCVGLSRPALASPTLTDSIGRWARLRLIASSCAPEIMSVPAPLFEQRVAL